MAFWTVLGNIALQFGMKVADRMLNDRGKETRPAIQDVTPPNWNNVVDVCDNIFNRGLDPVESIGNMRKSLYEQDPQVIRLALKVLESVIEERGIPVRNEREATQFLTDMRELLRDTRDRGVADGVFELNNAWSRACRRSPAFRGVGDLVDVLNSEGYRVLVTRDHRRITNENADASYCSSCDFQLPFDQLKHFCQYCNRIFCSDCCSYQQGIPPFQGNTPVCFCFECKSNRNSRFSPQAASCVQTIPKVYNNIRSSSPERNPVQNIRVGNVDNNEEDVEVSLVVPRHIAQDPEGWTISVQCLKTENATSEITGRTEKKGSHDMKQADENIKYKLYEKDLWQDNSDSAKVVTKSKMERRNLYLPSERQCYEKQQEEEENAAFPLNNSKAEHEDKELKLALERSRQTQPEEEESAAFRLNNSKAELEEEELKLALERSIQTQQEDMEVRLALEFSRRESEDKAKRNSTNRSFLQCHEDDGEMFLNITEGKHSKSNPHLGKGTMAFEVFSSRQSESQNSTYRSDDCWRKSSQCGAISKGSEIDEDEELQIALRRSLRESTRRKERSSFPEENDDEDLQETYYTCNQMPWPSYDGNRSSDEKDALLKDTEEHFKSEFGNSGKVLCCKKSEDNWEEEDELELAIKKEVKQDCFNCGQTECICDEADPILRAMELSRQESLKNQESCCEESKDNWQEDDELQRALKQVCYNCGKNNCVCKEDVLVKAIELSQRESLSTELPSRGNSQNFVSGKDSGLKSTGRPAVEEELREKRLRYFEKEKAKAELESLGHCSKQDAEYPAMFEKQHGEECHRSGAVQNKTSVIEEAKRKLVLQLSLQEMIDKEEKSTEESERGSDSDEEGPSHGPERKIMNFSGINKRKSVRN